MIGPPHHSVIAIARVLHASGASGLFAELYGDDDDDEAIVNQPVYLDGPLVSDDTYFASRVDRWTRKLILVEGVDQEFISR